MHTKHALLACAEVPGCPGGIWPGGRMTGGACTWGRGSIMPGAGPPTPLAGPARPFTQQVTIWVVQRFSSTLSLTGSKAGIQAATAHLCILPSVLHLVAPKYTY